MYRIRKLFKFEGAHILNNAFSKECTRCHGHSYKVEIIISSEKLNQDGMVIDFKKLNNIVRLILIDVIDHKLALDITRYTEEGTIPFPHDCIYPMYQNPTAENMASHFYDQIYEDIKREVHGFRSLFVRVHETDTGWAEYGREA